MSNPDVEVANGDRIRFVKQVFYGTMVSIGFPCCPSSSRFRTSGPSPKHAPAMSHAMCHAFQSKLPGSGPGAVAAAGLGTATFTIITIQKKYDVFSILISTISHFGKHVCDIGKVQDDVKHLSQFTSPGWKKYLAFGQKRDIQRLNFQNIAIPNI